MNGFGKDITRWEMQGLSHKLKPDQLPIDSMV